MAFSGTSKWGKQRGLAAGLLSDWSFELPGESPEARSLIPTPAWVPRTFPRDWALSSSWSDSQPAFAFTPPPTPRCTCDSASHQRTQCSCELTTGRVELWSLFLTWSPSSGRILTAAHPNGHIVPSSRSNFRPPSMRPPHGASPPHTFLVRLVLTTWVTPVCPSVVLSSSVPFCESLSLAERQSHVMAPGPWSRTRQPAPWTRDCPSAPTSFPVCREGR